MMLILERDELEWLNEIRNHQMAVKLLFRLYDEGKIKPKGFIEKLRKDIVETNAVLGNLAERGI